LLDQHAIGDLTFQPFSCQPELCNQLIHKRENKHQPNNIRKMLIIVLKEKSSDEQLTVPATSTISPGTSSVAGSIEKQPTGLTLINVLIS